MSKDIDSMNKQELDDVAELEALIKDAPEEEHERIAQEFVARKTTTTPKTSQPEIERMDGESMTDYIKRRNTILKTQANMQRNAERQVHDIYKQTEKRDVANEYINQQDANRQARTAPANTGLETFAQFQELRRTDPRKYYSAKVQKELVAARDNNPNFWS